MLKSFISFYIPILVLLVIPGVRGYGQSQDDPSDSQTPSLASNTTEREAERIKLELATGEDKIVDLNFAPNRSRDAISVGNPKVVIAQSVRIGEKRQLVFKPLSAGDTTVTVRDQDGFIRLIFDVEVAGTNLLKIASEVRDLLKDIEGLNIRVLGKKVVIDGEVLVPRDYGRLLNVLSDKTYGDLVLNLATLSEIAMQLLSKRIKGDINNFAPNVSTRVVNGQIWLEGTVDNLDQARRAARVAQLYLPDVKPSDPLDKDPNARRLPPRSLVQNFIVINPPPPKKQDKLVRVSVHFVELSKDYEKVFGFKWQPGFTADPQITIGSTNAGGAGASGPSFFATLSSLFPKLDSAQNAGYARVLRSGTVIVRSGRPAKLDSKNITPFAVRAPNGELTTSTTDVGISLAVTPLILGQSEDIELDVQLSQKNLAGKTPEGAAITSQNDVTTKIYVKSKESAAIAGVKSTNVITQFNKDDPNPGGFSGDTSPLFNLLRSKSFNKSNNQLVVFITPEIIINASQGTSDLKRNFRVKIR